MNVAAVEEHAHFSLGCDLKNDKISPRKSMREFLGTCTTGGAVDVGGKKSARSSAVGAPSSSLAAAATPPFALSSLPFFASNESSSLSLNSELDSAAALTVWRSLFAFKFAAAFSAGVTSSNQ